MVRHKDFLVLKEGVQHGIRSWLKLMSIVTPVFTLVKILQYSQILYTIARFTAPAMRYFRLPGEAAMALILGNFVNLYASMGVLFALQLPGPQFTVLSLMLLVSHSQLLETAVFFQIRAKWWLLAPVRLLVALVSGAGLGALIVRQDVKPVSLTLEQPTFEKALRDWGFGLTKTGLTMLVVLIIIFVLLELGRRSGMLNRFQSGVSRIIGFMGYSHEACIPWLAGNVFGVVFGAGLIVESVRSGKLPQRQVTLVAGFLALCHGLIEDTAIFMASYPAPFTWQHATHLFWIVIPRIVLAVGVTSGMNLLLPRH